MILNAGCGESVLGDVRLDIRKTKSVNVVADIHFLPLRDNVFDKVICKEVLEHLVSPFNSLKEILRVLVVNGLLIVSFPNVYEYRRIIWIFKFPSKVKFDVKEEEYLRHKQAWDNIEFIQLCKQVGLKVLSCDYVSLSNRRLRKLSFLDCVLKWLLPKMFFHIHVLFVLRKVKT